MKINFYKEIKGMLSAEDEKYFSSKRVITFVAFLLVSIAFVCDLLFDFEINEGIFSGMIQIIWAGLGFVTGEQLLKIRQANIEQAESTPTEECECNCNCNCNKTGDD